MSLFTEAGLLPEIVEAIEELGFKELTPIQEKAIPVLINSESDILALAQTGTGKTAAFGLPILQRIDLGKKEVQALVLSPTRELCMQITKDIESYSTKLKNFSTVAVYGGASITNQIKDIKRGAQVIVGTPGRTLDLIKRKALNISKIQWLVLDEADEMLNMGFQEDLDAILETSPEDKKVLLFSATMPGEIQRISRKYMKEPVELSVGKRNQGAENVKHEYYMVHARDRYAVLKRIADIYPNIYGIVFCRTRAETKEVADKLIADGYNADALHGDLSQAQRDSVMNRFRTKNLQLLVATDVAARGLDVNNLSHVINFNLPDDLEAYVHRSGRTGRAGKTGISVSIIHTRESRKMKDLQKMVGQEFVRKTVPNGREICEKQLFNLIDKVENIEVNNDQIEAYLPVIYKKLSWLSREDLIKHFVSVEFNRFLAYYENAPDLNIHEERESRESRGNRETKGGREREPRRSRTTSFSRFFVNLGNKDDVNVSTLLGYINRNMKGQKVEIGKVEIMKKFSFFEMDKNFEKDVLSAFRNAEFDGKEVVVELSKPEPMGSSKKYQDEPGFKRSKTKDFNPDKRKKYKDDGDKKSKFKGKRKPSKAF
jgi:ATP-dependent RNA helicase DeaD